MTDQDLVKYLNSPELLIEISLEELTKWTDKYPFSQQLKYLLWRKARQMEHPLEKKFEASCSTYTFNRQHLFNIVQNFQIPEVSTANNQLEKELVDKNENPVPESKILDYPKSSLEASTEDPVVNDSENLIEKGMKFDNMFEERQITLSSDVVKFVDKFMSLEQEQSVSPTHKHRDIEQLWEKKMQKEIHNQPEPMPKTAFSSWLSSLKAPKIISQIDEFVVPNTAMNSEIINKQEKAKPKASKPKKELEKSVAEKSLEDSDDIFSEHLADLLAKQGHQKRAIQMFEKLILAFPQKSSYFAEKIEKLKI